MKVVDVGIVIPFLAVLDGSGLTTPLRRSKGKIGEPLCFCQTTTMRKATKKRKTLLDFGLAVIN
ncbi:hypothetical protein [Devosia elaeis]|uniref:hypothetical protein n=1 Tax=Devosia elaeis TaxID=1770058 RepID=UPI0010427512|nr:hypothetical protein [Devosia elaeis]